AVYTKRDIDFIAAHVVPLDIWYIIPVEVCTPQPMLRFYPHRQAKKMRLEKYREAWRLLDPPLPNPPITIHACIDPDYPEKDYSEPFGHQHAVILSLTTQCPVKRISPTLRRR